MRTGPASDESSNARAAMWRAPLSPSSTSAETATLWWSTSSSSHFVMARPMCAGQGCTNASRDISASMHVIARLAALIPGPRTHLIRFHGLFAPNAGHRRLVVPAWTPASRGDGAEPGAVPTRAQMSRVQRPRRVSGIDVRRCPRRGAAVRVLAVLARRLLLRSARGQGHCRSGAHLRARQQPGTETVIARWVNEAGR